MQLYDGLLCNCMQCLWFLLPLSVKWVPFSAGCYEREFSDIGSTFPGWLTAVINQTAV